MMACKISFDEALADLMAGNQRFLTGQSRQSPQSSLARLKNFSQNGQSPKAIVLCCSDSRAPVEMIFDQDIGDLFVIRVAGNIVAPALVGSVEFAASSFGTKLVLVMGHSQCGAIKATLDAIERPNEDASINIQDLISRIIPHIRPIAQASQLSADEKMSHAVVANVRASVARLSHASTLIEKMVRQKDLAVIGAVLDLATGLVAVLGPEHSLALPKTSAKSA